MRRVPFMLHRICFYGENPHNSSRTKGRDSLVEIPEGVTLGTNKQYVLIRCSGAGTSSYFIQFSDGANINKVDEENQACGELCHVGECYYAAVALVPLPVRSRCQAPIVSDDTEARTSQTVVRTPEQNPSPQSDLLTTLGLKAPLSWEKSKLINWENPFSRAWIHRRRLPQRDKRGQNIQHCLAARQPMKSLHAHALLQAGITSTFSIHINVDLILTSVDLILFDVDIRMWI